MGAVRTKRYRAGDHRTAPYGIRISGATERADGQSNPRLRSRNASAQGADAFQTTARNRRDRHHGRPIGGTAARGDVAGPDGSNLRSGVMKANCRYGTHHVRVETVPDPKILNPRDAIVRVSTTAICGSDLHLYDGYIPTTQKGDILGHEFMGEVVDVGPKVNNLKVGDRVVVPFPIACGNCFFCQAEKYSL